MAKIIAVFIENIFISPSFEWYFQWIFKPRIAAVSFPNFINLTPFSSQFYYFCWKKSLFNNNVAVLQINYFLSLFVGFLCLRFSAVSYKVPIHFCCVFGIWENLQDFLNLFVGISDCFWKILGQYFFKYFFCLNFSVTPIAHVWRFPMSSMSHTLLYNFHWFSLCLFSLLLTPFLVS